jgi:hypothetical protein
MSDTGHKMEIMNIRAEEKNTGEELMQADVSELTLSQLGAVGGGCGEVIFG